MNNHRADNAPDPTRWEKIKRSWRHLREKYKNWWLLTLFIGLAGVVYQGIQKEIATKIIDFGKQLFTREERPLFIPFYICDTWGPVVGAEVSRLDEETVALSGKNGEGILRVMVEKDASPGDFVTIYVRKTGYPDLTRNVKIPPSDQDTTIIKRVRLGNIVPKTSVPKGEEAG